MLDLLLWALFLGMIAYGAVFLIRFAWDLYRINRTLDRLEQEERRGGVIPDGGESSPTLFYPGGPETIMRKEDIEKEQKHA